MANELRVTIAAEYTYGLEKVSAPEDFVDFGVDVSGKIVRRWSQTIGTSEEAIEVGDSAAGYHLFAVNRDTTNYVQLYAASGETAFARLAVGGPPAFIPTDSGSTYYAKANTASCRVEFFLCNP